MPVITTRLRVRAAYPGGASGLVGASPGLAIVITGTQFGNVLVSVRAGESDPGLDTGP